MSEINHTTPGRKCGASQMLVMRVPRLSCHRIPEFTKRWIVTQTEESMSLEGCEKTFMLPTMVCLIVKV